MSPLERRYRWLLRMLPADHRAARGEELLGLLLDLDYGRTRPSARQCIGILGLILRLRLADTATLLLAAYLLAAGVVGLGDAVKSIIEIRTGIIGFTPKPGYSVAFMFAEMMVTSIAWLAVAIAWILGAGRVAFVTAILLLTTLVCAFGWGEVSGTRLATFTLLAAAVRWRWPAPGQRGLLLLAVPGAGLLLLVAYQWQSHGVRYPVMDTLPGLLVAAVSALVAAVAAILLTRSRPLPTRLIALATGVSLGGLTPAALVTVVYGSEGWTLSLTAAVALLGIVGSRVRRRPIGLQLAHPASPPAES